MQVSKMPAPVAAQLPWWHLLPPSLDPTGALYIIMCHYLFFIFTQHNNSSNKSSESMKQSSQCKWVRMQVSKMPVASQLSSNSRWRQPPPKSTSKLSSNSQNMIEQGEWENHLHLWLLRNQDKMSPLYLLAYPRLSRVFMSFYWTLELLYWMWVKVE